MFSSAEQLLQPELQAMLQIPPEQAGAPLVPLQGVRQPPQWAVSVLRLTSHPLPGLPSQSEKPELQV